MMQNNSSFNDITVIIKGGGDIASGIAYRLFQSNFKVVILELEKPKLIRRKVSFGQAVYEKKVKVDGVKAVKVQTPINDKNFIYDIQEIFNRNEIPVIVDPESNSIRYLHPLVYVDATIAKRNTGTQQGMAPFVIGVGPGFTAGEDVNAIVETNRGHFLGRVIWEGSAEKNTGIPGTIGGVSAQRVVRACCDGFVNPVKKIGDMVREGEVIAWIDERPIKANISGVLRGLINTSVYVSKNLKIGDIDPRGKVSHCFSISDKALSIGGGVLEAILHWNAVKNYLQPA